MCNSDWVIPPREFQTQWSLHMIFRLSSPATWISDSVIPPREFRFIITSLVECARHVKFSLSDPARCYFIPSDPATWVPRGGRTEVWIHLAGSLSTWRDHWMHLAGLLFAYLYHRFKIHFLATLVSFHSWQTIHYLFWDSPVLRSTGMIECIHAYQPNNILCTLVYMYMYTYTCIHVYLCTRAHLIVWQDRKQKFNL